jgi:hypothetical protein
VVEIYANLRYRGQGDGRAVSHICNQCEGHSDQYSELIGFPTLEQHAGERNWGYRSGTRYPAVHVSGVIFRRTATEEQHHASGGGYQDTFVASYQWERRSIDHLEQRPYITWNVMTVVNCAHGVRPRSVSRVSDEESDEEMLMALLTSHGLLQPGIAFSDAQDAAPKLSSVFSEGDAEVAVSAVVDDQEVTVTFSRQGESVAILQLEHDAETKTLRTKAWREKEKPREKGS